MTCPILRCLLLLWIAAAGVAAQTLSVKWEELTAEDFVKAIAQAKGTCLLPFGVIEKHGPSGPLGTDLINVRHVSVSAAQQEYAVVFPEYYFGQIFEAKHQPGTIAYSTSLQLQLLQETSDEMARNGCKKIIIVNGHGGNTALSQYFSQIQLEKPKDYVVYAASGLGGSGSPPLPGSEPSKPGVDGHAGEAETSTTMASRPDLAFPDRGGRESGANLNRLDLPQGVFPGISWYAQYPNHYAGDSTGANAARGKLLAQMRIEGIANVIRAVKADQASLKLQQEFFERSGHPLDTPQ